MKCYTFPVIFAVMFVTSFGILIVMVIKEAVFSL